MDARDGRWTACTTCPACGSGLWSPPCTPSLGATPSAGLPPPVPGLLPGINHILPYASPSFRGECSEEAVFQLSRVCLESARDVISVLEQEYRALYGRNLTLSRLPEAIILLCARTRAPA